MADSVHNANRSHMRENCASLKSVEHEGEDEVSELEEELWREAGGHHDGVRQLEDGAGPPDRVEDAETAVEVERHQGESEKMMIDELSAMGDYHTPAGRTMEIVPPEGHIILPERRRRPEVLDNSVHWRPLIWSTDVRSFRI